MHGESRPTSSAPDETREKVPLLSDNIYGAMYTPGDGNARAWMLAGEMGRRAQETGSAAFYGDTTVTGIDVVDGRVTAVRTSGGTIKTNAVVCAAGIWGSLIGRMAGVTLPLPPMRHQYAITAPLPELAGETVRYPAPVIRHQDRAMYFRQDYDAYVIGSYDHEPLLLEPEDIWSHADAPEMPSMMPWSESAFRKGMISAGEFMPVLQDAELVQKVNGMFVFTPDGMPVLGESPHVKGFWSAEGVWITHGGGVGKAVAEWMVDGQPSMDLREADISRFHPPPAHPLVHHQARRSAVPRGLRHHPSRPSRLTTRADSAPCRTTTVLKSSAHTGSRTPDGSAPSGSRRTRSFWKVPPTMTTLAPDGRRVSGRPSSARSTGPSASVSDSSILPRSPSST